MSIAGSPRLKMGNHVKEGQSKSKLAERARARAYALSSALLALVAFNFRVLPLLKRFPQIRQEVQNYVIVM